MLESLAGHLAVLRRLFGIGSRCSELQLRLVSEPISDPDREVLLLLRRAFLLLVEVTSLTCGTWSSSGLEVALLDGFSTLWWPFSQQRAAVVHCPHLVILGCAAFDEKLVVRGMVHLAACLHSKTMTSLH